MKSPFALLFAAVALAFSLPAYADDKHDHHGHDHAHVGPSHGRVLVKFEPHAELLVNAQKHLEIRFLDEDLKILAPQNQVVSITMGERSNPTKMSFVKKGDAFISEQAIPEGKLLPTVIQIREKAGAKAVTERLTLNLEICETCKKAEYVCECEHDHGDHDHKHDAKKK